jgi:adenylate cyclase class 2
MKLREELETVVGDATLMLQILESLGFHVWFRYQKYREEFAFEDVIVAVDETPMGAFVELEGGEQGIAALAAALGCRPDDYLLESYRTLFVRHCEARGLPALHMLFDDE